MRVLISLVAVLAALSMTSVSYGKEAIVAKPETPKWVVMSHGQDKGCAAFLNLPNADAGLLVGENSAGLLTIQYISPSLSLPENAFPMPAYVSAYNMTNKDEQLPAFVLFLKDGFIFETTEEFLTQVAATATLNIDFRVNEMLSFKLGDFKTAKSNLEACMRDPSKWESHSL
jgi:hypothetical protein